MIKPLPSIERLQQLLDYDPTTGIFTWKVTRCGRAKVGQIAGSNRPHHSGLVYKMLIIDYKHYQAHRIAFYLMTGLQPLEVDHKNGNTLDNRFANLRDGTRINPRNKTKYCNNTSGTTGVYYRKDSGKWKARYAPQKLSKTFNTFEEAVAQRKEWEDIFGMTTLKSKRTST